MWQKIEELIQLSIQPLEKEVDLEKNPERRNYYRFLYHLIKWRKPKVALEIGVESGLASAYMAMGAMESDGLVIGIDINNVPRKPSNNYCFIRGDSTKQTIWNQVLKITQEVGPIGVVYQDSSHHYHASKEEWRLYSQLLDKDAIWICDDITPSFWDWRVDPPGKGMVQYFDEIPCQNKRLYQDVLHFGNCQGVVWLP